MPALRIRLFVALVGLLSVLAVAALAAVSGGDALERPWLALAFAAAIALEHLFETRLVVEGEQGESTTHEESFLVAMAFLTTSLAIALTFALGFLAGNVLRRREPLKAVFNVAAMALTAAVALLVVEALGGAADASRPRAAFAVVAGACVFVVVNRIVVAAVLAVAGGGRFTAHLLDDLGPRALVASGDIALGLLAGLAAAEHLWALGFGLAAVVAVHFSLSGHVRARAERRKLADIVASSSDGIASVDRHGRIRSWNPASEHITGLPAARVLGHEIDEIAHVLEAEPEGAEDAVPLAEVPPHAPYVVRVRAAAGETRSLRVSRAPLPEGGSVLVLHDETTRRQVDELRAERERERMRADFVATVSHELRTPLTSILGFTQTLLREEEDGAPRRRYLEIMRAEGERLRQLIDDLLELRGLAEERRRRESGHIDLGELLAEQVDAFSPQTGAHRLVLDVPREPLAVQGERRRLEQVVSNLLSNAIKYSPGGGDVHVSARRRDGRIEVAVRDEGLGIPDAQQAEIFTKFFRVEADDRHAIRGTGLGLALSREIVRAYGGDIGFRSKEGEGSTFFFELPETRGNPGFPHEPPPSPSTLS